MVLKQSNKTTSSPRRSLRQRQPRHLFTPTEDPRRRTATTRKELHRRRNHNIRQDHRFNIKRGGWRRITISERTLSVGLQRLERLREILRRNKMIVRDRPATQVQVVECKSGETAQPPLDVFERERIERRVRDFRPPPRPAPQLPVAEDKSDGDTDFRE